LDQEEDSVWLSNSKNLDSAYSGDVNFEDEVDYMELERKKK
jgi:hypothetical protein